MSISKKVYIELFHGRSDKEDKDGIEEWGDDGPILGPLEYIRFTMPITSEREEVSCMEIDAGISIVVGNSLLYYDKMYYGDFFITDEIEALKQSDRIEVPDRHKAKRRDGE